MNANTLKIIFSNNLKKYLSRNGISQTDLANELNIPETTFSNWMQAKTYPRPDKIQMLADYFKVTRSDLTEEEQSYESECPTSVRIPVLGAIACGVPILAEHNYEEYRFEATDHLPGGKLVYLKAKGNSMEPTIPNGAYVMVREQPDVESGEIAAVLVNGDTEATLKRIKKQGDIIMLMPDNPTHNPMIVNTENPAKIIGKAIRFTQDL
ncbi:XRE family transcriptional regulator [Bacillus thuringiensis]|nr:XRE family transcriptional regulator [Bacillus thuringiensis]MED2754717.1 XRE family transcriptional regulator [Bacillus thuringiensis]MED2771641.1 XRE family transcriptional regulator [Bacillus thuringiensis]MED2777212.1 XRE family transcriptional regulator [Bacillus thuringiensis]MED2783827.1 XRE family transcriptional regulator [Bacillus thuringiensis]